MKCPYCATEFDASATHCPGCGRIHDLPDAPTSRIVLIAVLVAALIGIVGFLALRALRVPYNSTAAYLRNRPQAPSHLAVEHGTIVPVNELRGHGKLYFVPMGRQAIPINDLVSYYQAKFNLKVTVLPEVKLSPGFCQEDRKQCVAEEMIFGAIRANPQIAADPASILIVVTDEDIFSESLDDDFNYSFHFRRHFGIVSSYHEGLDKDDHPVDAQRKLASTKQVLTKYIAYMYYQMPYSHDPTSILNQPFTPNGSTDDLFESDLHSENSANGYWGNDNPCFGFHYSYKTSTISPISSSVFPCTDMDNSVLSTDDETFKTEIFSGSFVQQAMDVRVPTSPAIEFRRGYVTRYPSDQAFGVGANVNYNAWLASDGIDKLTFVDIIHEDGSRDHLSRTSEGKGFSPAILFEGSGDIKTYKARMTWDKDHFKLAYFDGASSTFLPCSGNSDCFWSGYQDLQGRVLRIERGPKRELLRVASSDGKQIECKSDDRRRIVSAKDSGGHNVVYEYDKAGNLEKVHRADGQVAIYGYDKDHNMTSFSVMRHLGVVPKLILTNEYDTYGRISKQALADGRSCHIVYLFPANSSSFHSVATDLSGRSIDIVPEGNQDGYIAKAQPLKYRALLKIAKADTSSQR